MKTNQWFFLSMILRIEGKNLLTKNSINYSNVQQIKIIAHTVCIFQKNLDDLT